MLSAKIEISTAPATIQTSAKPTPTEIAPITSGRAAAVRLPNTASRTSNRNGTPSNSARCKSDFVNCSISW